MTNEEIFETLSNVYMTPQEHRAWKELYAKVIKYEDDKENTTKVTGKRGNMKGLRINFQSDKDFIYFLPTITLHADKMLHPFRTNYFLRMGFLHWQIRITWYKEAENGIQRNI